MKQNSFLIIALLPFATLAQEPSVQVGENEIHFIFNDSFATPESKALFYSDFSKEIAASENGLSILVTTNKWHPASMYSPGTKTNLVLHGLAEPKFTNGDFGLPTTLVWTNDILALPVPKQITDAYAVLCTFESAYSNEIAKLRTFVANNLAADRLASLSDDDIYEMYLSKQWEPGDRNGPSRLSDQDRPQILRGIYYQPPVAAVLSWPMGPSDAPEHLWAQIHVRAGGRVYETRAIYFRDQWWLTIWDWEDDPPVWMP